MSNTETAKSKGINGPTTIEGYVTCEGGTATVRTPFSTVTCVQLTQQVGIDPNTAPPEFEVRRSDGANTVFIYSNNQQQGDDVVWYRISGTL
jgi:hypothetical protein